MTKPSKGLGTLDNIVVDWDKEYRVLHDKMHTKGCNYDNIISSAYLLGLNCPDMDFMDKIHNLVHECQERRAFELKHGMRTFEELYDL